MNKEKLTRAELELATSGLTCRALPTELSRPVLAAYDFLDKLQHELMRCVCAEDEIFDFAFPLSSCDVTNACIIILFSSTLIQVFPYSANISDMK